MAQESFGWLSEALKWPSLIVFGLFDIALAITIIILTAKSSTEHGFVTIPSRNTTSSSSLAPVRFNVSLDLGILWTALPSFVFALFAAYWAWIACAIAERQPYVELRSRGGAEARKSILLDYRVTPVVFRWWSAFRKSHGTVGAMTLLSVLLTYITAPLAARLFTPQVVSVSKTLPITYDTEFSDSNINSTIDWQPILNVVAATLLYRGKSIAWTDDQYAFRPFSNHSIVPASADIEAETTAFAAYVNCVVVKDYTITSNGDSSSSQGTVTVSGDDRGCSFRQKFGVASTQKTYLKSTSVIDCSAQAYYSRLVFTAGVYSSSASNLLDDISVISCATGYRQVDGNLKVSTLATSPTIQSFDETGQPDTSRPTLWRIFEQGILGPVTFNPKAKSSTSDMGDLILQYARKLQPSNPLSPEVLIRSISSIFTATYLNGVGSHGFSLLSNPEASTGKAFIPTTRLFVVPWVAYVILIFLLIAFCFLVWAFFYVYKRPSILTEEPEGLLSAAAILSESDLLRIISSIRKEPGFDGNVRGRGKKNSEVMDRKWTATKDDEHGQWVISPI
ncbi:hypothetical protein IWW34DRAFT_669739 [Fusarium oxysporum f. sp. albedinis]|nr:hypothetical protein IWW34DRAFT_669739 [Fusarium oxysporum f. sp. albedinis]KAJ0131636.1 Kinetochore protein mis13 [Fusarium oxysporum f. sp. albedinis]KAJ0133948.1 Acetamidase [Fusarium oxysporum f. sp. albedinis]KAK2480523.1 hypothetical protein H9L39_06162 [Fusarium oxysporum f. sp. albedinis]